MTKTKFVPGQGYSFHADEYNCSVSCKIDFSKQMLIVDCMATNSDGIAQFPESLISLSESDRLPGWKRLITYPLQKIFNHEDILSTAWDRLCLSNVKREQVKDWLISALTYTSTPLIPEGLKQAYA